MNIEEKQGYPKYLQDLPYVNGGLFTKEYPVPIFNKQIRKTIIECGSLDWASINPDILGSMMQAVVNQTERSNLGIHYTSVVNIMKVIKPILLNNLYSDLEKAENHEKKLEKILRRLYNIRIFDPACGSGNFLIISYKELCKIEIEIYKQLQKINKNKWSLSISGIRLNQFYGIEIDNFSHEIAKISLWISQHQMNLSFKEVFGITRPSLPIKDAGKIICSDATRTKWEELCNIDEDKEIYILSNPPYLGSSNQTKKQKEDMEIVFYGKKNYKNLDYIACWFILGAKFIQKKRNANLSFISTKSISQGEQVSMLWPHLFKLGIEINFAHQAFRWTNNARDKAGVTCVIIGLRKISNKPKILYNNNITKVVKNISPYLSNGKNIIIKKINFSISNLQTMIYGNKAVDGGNLILSGQEKDKLLLNFPKSKKLIKRIMGADEFIKDKKRYCLWINNEDLDLANTMEPIRQRIKNVSKMRLKSKDLGANELASRSHQFRDMNVSKNHSIIIPSTTSERRKYIPMGFLDKEIIITNAAYVMYDPPSYVFAIISSRIHMVWVRVVAGYLGTSIRYTSGLCYNTFPFPKIDKDQKSLLEKHTFNIINEREKYSEKNLSQLYDPDKMPIGLLQAHEKMDIDIEKCYRSNPFISDEERLEYLFELYDNIMNKNTLF